MINADQITAKLRLMSDADLQRFAEMHKQDPYMFPLAFNESNMRKQVRTQQGSQQPQVPVNQQALASMQPQLPEDQGVGALNPEMEFAGGGLIGFASGGEPVSAATYSRPDGMPFSTGGVAYADGGAVRFASGGESVSSRRIATRDLLGGSTRPVPHFGGVPLTDLKNYREYPPEGYVGYFPVNIMDDGKEPVRATPTIPTSATPTIPTSATPTIPTSATPTIPTSATPLPSGAIPLKSQASAGIVPPDVLAAAKAGAPSGVQQLVQKQSSMPNMPNMPSDTGVSDIKKLYAKAISDEQRLAQERFDEYAKGRPGSETFAEEKALLAEDTEANEKQQRMNEGLAWLTFASNVMQPGKTPIQAIVEGATAGIGQYSKAQSDIKKAEKERKAGLAALARMERAEVRKDHEASNAAQRQFFSSVDNMRVSSIDAIGKAMSLDNENATRVFMNQVNNAADIEKANIMAGSRLDVANTRVGNPNTLTPENKAKMFEDFIKTNPVYATLPYKEQMLLFQTHLGNMGMPLGIIDKPNSEADLKRKP